MPKQTRGHNPELRKAPKTGELHLVFCNHAVDNYPRILDAVAKTKPDIIAVELAAETALMRLDFEHEVNAQLSAVHRVRWLMTSVISKKISSNDSKASTSLT